MGDTEKRPYLSPLWRPVSRRDVLKKGAFGLAGLTVAPAVIAACSSTATASPSAAPASQAAGGTLKVGSNLSDAVPKKALQDLVDAFTTQTGITVKVNTVDHSTFQDQLSSYLQATPDDAFTWFSGYRMRFFAAQGLATSIDDVWSSVGSNFSAAMKTASTGDDGHQYLIPWNTYAWTVYYRKSVFSAHSYQIPTTLDAFKALAAQMQKDGLVPIGLGQKDGWPARATSTSSTCGRTATSSTSTCWPARPSGPTPRSSRSSPSGRPCSPSTRRAPPVASGRTPRQGSSRRRPA